MRVSFPPLSGSAGVTYTLVLELPGRPLSSVIGIHYNTFDALSSGQMYVDGKSTSGDTLNAFYRYDMGSLWSDIGGTLGNRSWLLLSWLALLLLPGVALVLWLPNGLTAGQRLLAAPALSVLVLPVFLLITRSLGIKLGTVTMWVVMEHVVSPSSCMQF